MKREKSPGGEADELTLYQSMLELTLQLCKAYPALTPFSVRRERAHEVFLLVRRINSQPQKGGGSTARRNREETDSKGRIRRPAGDKWF